MVEAKTEMPPSSDTHRPTVAPTKAIISAASNTAHNSMQRWLQDTDQAKGSHSSNALRKIEAANLAFSSQNTQYHCEQQPLVNTTVS